MSAGEHFARGAMGASRTMQHEVDAVADAAAEAVVERMRPFMLELHQSAVLANRESMVEASREGFRQAFEAALTEENARRVFAIGVDVLAESATKRAGRWFLGGVGKGLAALRWPIVLLAGAYFIGGLPLLKTMWGLIWNRGG